MARLEICRICLRTDTKMFDLSKMNLKKFYEEIMAYELDTQDGLPHCICYECAALLHKFFKFREKCSVGQNTLIEMTWVGSITFAKVRKVYRKKKNLASPLQITALESVTYSPDGPEGSYQEVKVESCEAFKTDHVKLENSDHESISHDDIADFETVENIEMVEEKEEIFVEEMPVRKKSHKSKNKRVLRKPIGELLDPSHWNTTYLNDDEAWKEFRARAETGYYTRAAYKCTLCLKGFSKEDMLLRHQKRMHREGHNLKECHFCHERFGSLARCKQHLGGHYARFQCLRCEKKPVFCLESSALLHDETHKDLAKICIHCGKEFKHNSTLYTHLRTHRSQHVCPICGVSFVSAVGLNQHRVHKHADGVDVTREPQPEEEDDDRPIPCERCDVTFSSRRAYREHFFQSELHTELIEEEINIPKDQKVLDKKSRAAIGAKLGIADKRDEDKRKNRGGGAAPFKRRTKEKAPRRPTTCRHCGKFFDGLVKCIKHHRVEHAGLPFHQDSEKTICEVCGAILAPGSVFAHLNKHSLRVLHPCNTCGRSFTQSSGLTRHMLTHTGEKPWPCKVCGKRFTQSNSARLHYRTVHLKMPHPKRNRSKKVLIEDTMELTRRSM